MCLISFVAVDRDGALLILHCLGNRLGRAKPHIIFADATALPVSELRRILDIQRTLLERYLVSWPETKVFTR